MMAVPKLESFLISINIARQSNYVYETIMMTLILAKYKSNKLVQL